MATATQTKPLNLLRIAAELVTEGARHGSPSMLMRRIHQDHGLRIGFENAFALLIELHAAGIAGPYNHETLTYPILLDRQAALALLENYTPSGHSNWRTLYECPQCLHAASWTDGRKVSAGDEVDEFWCQTCGAEVPLSVCTVIATA